MWEYTATKSGEVLALQREVCLKNWNLHLQLKKPNKLKAVRNRIEVIRSIEKMIWDSIIKQKVFKMPQIKKFIKNKNNKIRNKLR